MEYLLAMLKYWNGNIQKQADETTTKQWTEID